mmetsp:Transcript_13791/g.32017  ORF Transcript_13791/g.32017 Transcript_13791/m.32017 type:complete len:221 (+) Transcript_13791:1767-2429(+)
MGLKVTSAGSLLRVALLVGEASDEEVSPVRPEYRSRFQTSRRGDEDLSERRVRWGDREGTRSLGGPLRAEMEATMGVDLWFGERGGEGNGDETGERPGIGEDPACTAAPNSPNIDGGGSSPGVATGQPPASPLANPPKPTAASNSPDSSTAIGSCTVEMLDNASVMFLTVDCVRTVATGSMAKTASIASAESPRLDRKRVSSCSAFSRMLGPPAARRAAW